MKYDLYTHLCNLVVKASFAVSISAALSGIIKRPGVITEVLVEKSAVNDSDKRTIKIDGDGLKGNIRIENLKNFGSSFSYNIESDKDGVKVLFELGRDGFFKLSILNADGIYHAIGFPHFKDLSGSLTTSFYDNESVEFLKSRGWKPSPSSLDGISIYMQENGIVPDTTGRIDSTELREHEDNIGAYLFNGEWTKTSFKNTDGPKLK